MTKRQKNPKGFAGIMKHWVKPAIKASTHVLTIGGVVLLVSPAARGVAQLAKGDLTGAKDHILYDTVGSGTTSGLNLTDSLRQAAVNVGIPAAIGVGLIAVG